MGSIARMDPKLPSKFLDVSWPSSPTPSSKSFFQSDWLSYMSYMAGWHIYFAPNFAFFGSTLLRLISIRTQETAVAKSVAPEI